MELVTLYHCTNESAARLICEEGLKITKEHGVTRGKIFLSTKPAHIFGCVCFKVTVPSDWVELHYSNWEYISKRNIPKEWIGFYSYEEDE